MTGPAAAARRPGRRPASTPVLFVHGQPGRGRDWDGVVAHLPSGFRAVAPDRPGYGGGQALSMAANAAALAQVLRGGGEGGAVVVGHSYGGGIALLLTAGWPDLVTGLVLVASIGGEDGVAPVDRLLATPVVGPALSAVALAASAWIGPRLRRRLSSLDLGPARIVGRSFPDDRSAAAVGGRAARRSFAVEQRALVTELPAVREAVGRVSCPTVVVVGTRDLVVPPRAGARLAAGIGGAALWTVARAGHFLPGDAPTVVARAVTEVAGRASPR